MANIQPKIDYNDGDILYGSDLNASNEVIKAGVDDNFARIQALDLEKQDNLTADVDYLTPSTASETYEVKKGVNDFYVTNDEKIKIANTSGVNTGDETNSTIKTKLGAASASNDGYLSKEDYTMLNDKQDKLVSGTNIKTINGNSVLGSGNIVIAGGSGSGDVVGPDSSSNLSIPIFDGYTGKIIKDSGVTFEDIDSTLDNIIEVMHDAFSLKEDKLPETPTDPESKFLNGNKQWTPLALRHSQLSDKNGEELYQHITQLEKDKIGDSIISSDGSIIDIINCTYAEYELIVDKTEKLFVIYDNLSTDGIYYEDNKITSLSNFSGDTPVGAINLWATNTSPTNWLICDGSAISRTTYSDLFGVIGTTYGVGDGSTTFNLPNLKGKVPVGKDISQTEFNTIGKTGGEKAHALTSDENGPHVHTISDVFGYAAVSAGVSTSNVYQNGNVQSKSTSTSGTGAPHNNLQPYIVLNYIIRAFPTLVSVSTVEQTLDSNSTVNVPSVSAVKTINDNLENVIAYKNATATTNGDFKINITKPLSTNMILYISFPTATINTSNARLSIDDGTNYVNIKLLRGTSTIPAKVIENQKFRIYYNGTNWIVDDKLVAYLEWSSNTTTFTVDNLNLMADGGVYDILTTMFYGSTIALEDLILRFNGLQTATYISNREFSRKEGNSTGAGTVSSYINYAGIGWYLGDLRNDANVLKTTITTSKVGPYINAQHESTHSSCYGNGQSIVKSGGSNITNITNITTLTFLTMGTGVFGSGVIRIYKK